MNRIIPIALAICLFSLAGCKKSHDVSGTYDDLMCSGDLVGTWQSACYQAPDGTYQIANVVVTTTQMSRHLDLYDNDSTCTTKLLEADFVLDYSVGNNHFVTNGSGCSRDIDGTFQSVTLTIRSAGLAASAATNSLCGFSDWVVDQPEDLSHRTVSCAGFGSQPNVNGDPLYTILQRDDTVSPNVLRFGDNTTHDEATPSTRSVEVFQNPALVKQ